MPPKEGIQQMCSWSGQIRRMAFAAIKRRHPDLTENEVTLKFIVLTYGVNLAEETRQWQQEQNQ